MSNIAEAKNFMAWYFEGCRLIETAHAAYSGCAKTMTLTGARFASAPEALVVQHTNQMKNRAIPPTKHAKIDNDKKPLHHCTSAIRNRT